MGVHRTCGEPDKIKGNVNQGKISIKGNAHPGYVTAPFGEQDNNIMECLFVILGSPEKWNTNGHLHREPEDPEASHAHACCRTPRPRYYPSPRGNIHAMGN